MKTLSTTLMLGLGLLLGCGGGGGGDSATPSNTVPPPPTGTIYVGMGTYSGTSNIFNPANLAVKAGDTVTWKWMVDGHTVDSGTSCTPDAAGPDHYTSGGVQSAGHTMTHVFATAGTYSYYCTTHCGMAMTGTVTVNP